MASVTRAANSGTILIALACLILPLSQAESSAGPGTVLAAQIAAGLGTNAANSKPSSISGEAKPTPRRHPEPLEETGTRRKSRLLAAAGLATFSILLLAAGLALLRAFRQR